MQFLQLEDVQEDSPQARSLLNLFEEDALLMVKYATEVEAAFRGVIDAQGMVAHCTQGLSQKLLEYEKFASKFPLGRDESILVSTLQQFAVSLEKITSLHGFLNKELTSCSKPLREFLLQDGASIETHKELSRQVQQNHTAALTKYSKVSKRKELETKASIEANEELHNARKQLQKVMLERYSNLNMLQYKRSICLLEPLVGALTSYRKFQSMGAQVHSKESGEYISDISESVKSVKVEMSKFAEKTATKISEIERNSTYYYIPEPTPDLRMASKPINRSLHQKGGYLWIRSKSGLGHKWDRRYFFIQGSNLMSQEKDEIAGGLVLDLENCISQPVDVDDRRFVFQITDTSNYQRSVILQAMSNPEREEWICTIRNITGYADQGSQKQSLPQVKTNQRQVPPPATAFQGQTTPTREKRKSSIPQGKDQQRAPSSPLDNILPQVPIQFDISPMTEEATNMNAAASSKDGPPKRINPFSQSASQIRVEQSSANIPGYLQTFLVRFLGSMEVQTNQGPGVVMETTRHIMTARAIHNIFKTTESNFVVTTEDVRLQDLSSQTTRAIFPLKDISYWTVHQENKRKLHDGQGLAVKTSPQQAPTNNRVSRWFAFISNTQGKEGSKHTCYVFETDSAAQELCNSLNVAAEIAMQALMQRSQLQQERELNQSSADPAFPYAYIGPQGAAANTPPNSTARVPQDYTTDVSGGPPRSISGIRRLSGTTTHYAAVGPEGAACPMEPKTAASPPITSANIPGGTAVRNPGPSMPSGIYASPPSTAGVPQNGDPQILPISLLSLNSNPPIQQALHQN